MDGGMLAWIIPLTVIVGGAIGWLGRQYQYHREARRQATFDASQILKEKKSHIEDMISKTDDDRKKEELSTQLNEINDELRGLFTVSLRHILKNAGLPTEDALLTEGRSQLEPQQVDELNREIAEVKNLPPSDSIQELFTLAYAYFYAGEYTNAKDICNRILSLDPDNPYAFNDHGCTNHKLENYHEALADFSHALKLKPDYPKALYNRGTTYINLEKHEEALADYNRALQLKPEFPEALNNRGLAYCKLGKYEEALSDFNCSLELRPDDPHTLYNLACFFSLQGNADDALAYLEKAINKDNKNKDDAKTDKDFDNIKEDPRFKKLIGED